MTLPEAAHLHADTYIREAHDPEKSFLAGAEWILPEILAWMREKCVTPSSGHNGWAVWGVTHYITTEELIEIFKKEKGQ